MDRDEKFLELAPIAVSLVRKQTGMVGSYVTEDDLINEAYAYGYWRKYTEWSNVSLLTVIKFDMIRGLRKLKYQGDVVDEADEKAGSGPPVYEKLITEDFMAYVWREASLSSGEKGVIDRMYTGGLTIAEIAKEDGVSRQTVNTMRRRAFTKIERLVGDYYDV